MTRKIIRVDGSETELDHKVSMAEIRAFIGAATLDSFMLADRIHVCMVDDNGWETETIERPGRIELKPTRARKPINEKATALYHAICRPGTTHQIAGDVVIVPDEDYA